MAYGCPAPSRGDRRYVVLRAIAVALAIAAHASSLAAAAAPRETVLVRTGEHPEFGRLVLEWPRPITVESEHAADRLTLRFARPFAAADLARAARNLGSYLRGIERTADPHELAIALAPRVAIELQTYDERIVALDLRHQDTVTVRTGLHEGYARVVLDWGAPIAFQASEADRRVEVTFARPGAIDLGGISTRLRGWLEGARAGGRAGRSVVDLTLAPGVGARVFAVEGTKVVIDLERQSATVAPQETARPSGPALPEPAAAPSPEATQETPPRPVPFAFTAEAGAEGIVLDFAWPTAVGAAVLTRAGHLWTVFGAAPPSDDTAFRALESPALRGYLGPGQLVAARGGVAARFRLLRPLAASVVRDGNHWRIALRANAPPPAPVEVVRRQGPARLRLAAAEAPRLVELTDPEVGDRLQCWPLLAPGRGQPKARRLVDVELLATAQGLVWRARAGGVAPRLLDAAIELMMPDGLRLSLPPPAAPAEAPPSGEPDRAPSADRSAAADGARPELPPSAAPGAPMDRAAAPIAAPEPARTPRGADDVPASPPTELEHSAASARGPLALAGSALAEGESVDQRRTTLIRKVIEAPPEARERPRLDLARFYLARGLGAEALAVLGVVEHAHAAGGALRDDPAGQHGGAGHAGANPLGLARRALRGVAAFLMDRPDEAMDALAAAGLDDDPEVGLWRAALAAARADWPQASEAFARSDEVLASYPPRLQLRLGLLAARAALESAHQDRARLILGRLVGLELPPAGRARVRFLEGLAKARAGETDDADRIWRALERTRDDRTRAEASYARLQMLHQAGRLDASELLAALEAARSRWRGHPSELEMLDGLARTYLEVADYPSAIRTWQHLLHRFPEATGAARIAEVMEETFVNALLADGDDGLTAVRGLALYRDFPELVPAGDAGARIRRQLADQLARLDLIEPAAALLAELLDGAAEPAAKAETGAFLAELWLRVPDAQAALAALERSAVAADLPAALVTRRRQARARALAGLGRPKDALATLDPLDDPATRRLRAELLWQARDWPRSVAAIEAVLATRPEGDVPLSPADERLVLRLAVAEAHLARPAALGRLRARFGAALRGSAVEPAFLMATTTASTAQPGVPRTTLADAAEHLERLQAFRTARAAVD